MGYTLCNAARVEYSVLEDRFNTLAKQHEQLIVIKDEHKVGTCIFVILHKG